MSENNTTLTDQLEFDPVRWPGAIMIVFSLACISAYVLCLTSILRNKDTARAPSYQIIIHIGVSDITQLFLTGIIGGIFSLCQSDFNFYLNKAIGGIVNSVWVVYITMANLLAWNRLLHTYNAPLAKRIFTLMNTRIMLAVCWMYGLAWVIAYMCPNLDLIYDPTEHNWSYGPHPSAQMFATCELSQDMFQCICMALCYAAIIFKLIRQSRQIANIHQLNTDKKEQIVLIQSTWLCLVSCSAVLLFFFNTAIIPNHWAMFFATMVWLGMAGSNAFIYILFNKTVRRQVKDLLKCGQSAVSVIGPGSTSTKQSVGTPRMVNVLPAAS